jgi:putative hydrolase of the HAD superfamily
VINLVHLLKEKGYNLYVLSNTASGMLESRQHDYNFFELFDGILLSHEVGAVKPYAKIYNILLEKYNLKPEECLFIDDFAWNVEGAKKVGIDGVVCTDPDVMISELATLGVLSKEEGNSLA